MCKPAVNRSQDRVRVASPAIGMPSPPPPERPLNNNESLQSGEERALGMYQLPSDIMHFDGDDIDLDGDGNPDAYDISITGDSDSDYEIQVASLYCSVTSKDFENEDDHVGAAYALLQIGILHLDHDQYGRAESAFLSALALLDTPAFGNDYLPTTIHGENCNAICAASRTLICASASMDDDKYAVLRAVLNSMGHSQFKRNKYQESMIFFIFAQKLKELKVGSCGRQEIMAETDLMRSMAILHNSRREYQLALDANLAALLGYTVFGG